MAPTELLAEQHCRSLSPLLEGAGLRVGLLTGAVKGKARKQLYAALERGGLDLVIGTHALLSEGVTFANLGLVVTDEQHRFGVGQRAALAAKAAGQPHVLVMSATPIPRTLALIIYGDLDVSVVDELPPGRSPVETYVVGEDKRQRMYNFVRRLVGEGRQAYIVCPAVEEGEADGEEPGPGDPAALKAAVTYAESLRTRVFPTMSGIQYYHQIPGLRTIRQTSGFRFPVYFGRSLCNGILRRFVFYHISIFIKCQKGSSHARLFRHPAFSNCISFFHHCIGSSLTVPVYTITGIYPHGVQIHIVCNIIYIYAYLQKMIDPRLALICIIHRKSYRGFSNLPSLYRQLLPCFLILIY